MTRPRTCPVADQEGFVSYERLREDARHLALDAFVRAYPRPALRAQDTGEDSSAIRRFIGTLDRGVHRHVQRWTQRVDDGGYLRYLDKAAFVTKRPGTPFPKVVSIGRAPANDIVLTVGTISKVHGYFFEEPDGWYFTDPGSTNGTRLEGRRLTPNVKARLEDGSTLRFGQETTLRFLLPPSLWEQARTD